MTWCPQTQHLIMLGLQDNHHVIHAVEGFTCTQVNFCQGDFSKVFHSMVKLIELHNTASYIAFS